jgi:hypothetical protein
MATLSSASDVWVHHLRGRLRLLVPGTYAWALTVLTPGLRQPDFGPALGVAFLAYLPLTATLFAPQRHLRALGLGFVGLCSLCWALLGEDLSTVHIDLLPGMLGSVGWALFALAWTTPVKAAASALDSQSPARPLEPRAQPALLPVVGLVSITLLAFLPVALAWRVTRPFAALLAHSVALAAAILLLSVASRFVIAYGSWQPAGRPCARLGQAGTTLVVLAIVAAMGLGLALL